MKKCRMKKDDAKKNHGRTKKEKGDKTKVKRAKKERSEGKENMDGRM
jgi:hypothetical protein